MSMMLAIALTLFPSLASAADRGDRAFTRDMAREIQLPTPIEMSQASAISSTTARRSWGCSSI